MIHTVDTISVRTYGEVDRAGDLSLLKRWFNPFPVKWFDLDNFFDEYKSIFSIKSNLGDGVYRLLAHNKILMLDRMLKTMSILMRNQNERSLFAMMFKREPKEHEGNLKFYVKKVKELTGIEIKDGEGLKALQKEIERLSDKYIERFKEKEEGKPVKTDFLDLVFGVCSIMQMQYIPEMKLSEFGRLKALADKKIQQAKS